VVVVGRSGSTRIRPSPPSPNRPPLMQTDRMPTWARVHFGAWTSLVLLGTAPHHAASERAFARSC
jgi:hypothetical protein